MRVLNNGIANNFGLVGKSLRRYLTTTALTATSLAAIASPALADNWTDHVATEGSISIDTSVPSTTNIKQNTSFVKVQGDGDINAGWTVNVAQPSSSSKYVLYDIEGDATQIMGALNANGQVYIFDQNGVIFGENSQVNVGSIVTSTGHISDANIKADQLKFVDVAGEGKIINKGTITVADAGLAAFVAPGVENAGVINAKLGKVALASGNTVTLDLYGDNLVEIAVDGKLENALVQNSGTINANGGTVALTAQAAKGAVDNVINMDGVIDVSSVTTKGGKIILGGGNSGVVKVSGKLKADGKSGGGDVKVTGQNVVADEASEISVNATEGNGGNVLVYGRDYAIFGGRVSGRGTNGGNAEISGGEAVGYFGMTDLRGTTGTTGTLLIDPKNLTISNGSTSGVVADFLSGGTTNNVTINAQALADTLASTNVNLWASQTLNTSGTIDLSTWSAFFGLVKGITSYDLNLAAPTVNINGDVILGTGKLNVNDHLAGISPLGLGLIPAPTNIIVGTLNLNGTIKSRSVVGGATSVVTDDAKLNTTANTINVKSNAAKIQQAILFAKNAGATINVDKGTYNESLLVNKSVKLYGAKKGLNGTNAARGMNETIIAPNSPGVHITAADVTVDGFTVTGASGVADGYGIWVDHANNATISNNIVNASQLDGIKTDTSDSTEILFNKVTNTGRVGIYAANATNYLVQGNTLNHATFDIGSPYGAITTDWGSDISIKDNKVTDSTQGIRVYLGGGTILLDHNTIDTMTSDGIFVTGSTGNGSTRIRNSVISNTDGNGILLVDTDLAKIERSTITNAKGAAGIYVKDSDNVTVGIYNSGSDRGTNRINNATNNGITVDGGNSVNVYFNTVDHAGGYGIEGINVGDLSVFGNWVRNGVGLTDIGIYAHGGSKNNATNNWVESVIGGISFQNLTGLDNWIYGNRVKIITADGITADTVASLKIQKNRVSDGLGDGIFVTKSDDAEILSNDVWNLTGVGHDNGSGVYIYKANRATVFDNYIDNVTWDGVKVSPSEGTKVLSNRISNVKREGIYGDKADGIIVQGNTIRDILNTDFAGVQLKNSKNVTVGGFGEGESNEIYNADFGIRAEKLTGLNKIHNNIIHDIKTNGIKLWNAANNVFVQGNDIDDTGKEGIYAEKGTNLSITENHIDDTGADGVHITEYLGTVDVSDNFIGTDGANIKGDGIYLNKTNNATVTGNEIDGLQSGGNDNNSGVYAFKSNGTYIYDNDITNAAWDGVKVQASTGNRVIKNRISNIKREGVFGDVADGIIIQNNTIHHMLKPNFAGVQLQRSKNIMVGGLGEDEANEIYNADYGVRMKNIHAGNNTIKGNTIYDIYTDGIQAETTTDLVIEGNDIDRTGGHGIDLFNSDGELNVTGNFITTTGQNGIVVGEVDDVLINDNVIDLAGWDGIHVHYFGNADILGNDIDRSGDDGIEAHDGSSVLIDGNEISQSGIGTIIIDEPPVEYGGFDEFGGGHDGISVRRMSAENEELPYGKYVYGYTPASVRITNNQIVAGAPEEEPSEVASKIAINGGGISTSGDDGIEVVDVDGYVYIYNNDVAKSGTDGETSYGEADMYGADGIHVRNVFANGDLYSVVQKGDVGNGEYNIVVANNRVSDSLDDGIEIIGGGGEIRVTKLVALDSAYPYFGYGNTQRVLVKDNTVNNSGYGNPLAGFGQAYTGFGGDGITVTGIYPDGYYAVGESEDGEFEGYAVDILHNTVNNSGDDGIEVTYSSSTLIDDNTVTNSGTAFQGEESSITTGDQYGADGIHVRNVGYEYYDEGSDDEVANKNSIFALEELEGEEYTPYSVVIRRNNVDNSQDDGIQVDNTMWQEYTAPVLVDSNENVSNSGNHGLYISGGSHSNVIVSNNAFANFDIGAEFESGLIDLRGVGNTFTDGRVGLRFAPYQFGSEGEPSFAYLKLEEDDAPGVEAYVPGVRPTNYGGTIGSQIFTGFLEDGDYYVELANGAFYNPGTPTWLNGLNSTYDTIQPSLTDGLLSEADFNFLEDRFHHYPDGLISGEDLGLFWFGYFIPETADINQKDLFNVFGAFNGDITGLNVRITGLPRLPGQAGGGGTTAQGFNNIETFAGGQGSNPSDLNSIETAAGGPDDQQTEPNQLADIETEAGGDSDSCWSSAANTAAGGQTVNVVYGGSMSDNLNQAAACGTSF
jgi:filamentous hemagglutinin family protein